MSAWDSLLTNREIEHSAVSSADGVENVVPLPGNINIT